MNLAADRQGTVTVDVLPASAYPLFTKHGSSEVGVRFLQQRVLEWSYGLVSSGSDTRLPGATAEQRLLSIFDIFHEWFQREDYEAAVIIDSMLDLAGGVQPIDGRVDYLQEIRSQLVTYATEVNFTDPTGFALSWHVLMKGAIFAAVEGDHDAALRAKKMAHSLIGTCSSVATDSLDDTFDYEFFDMTDSTVVLKLSDIGVDLLDYETAALLADQETHHSD
jgi:hypothetical protein